MSLFKIRDTKYKQRYVTASSQRVCVVSAAFSNSTAGTRFLISNPGFDGHFVLACKIPKTQSIVVNPVYCANQVMTPCLQARFKAGK